MIKTQKQYIKNIPQSLFEDSKEIDKNDVLAVIDMQNDFMDRAYVEKVGTFSRPGKKNTQTVRRNTGKLPTHDSKNIIRSIAKLTKKFINNNSCVVATRDYHPIDPEHCSFSIFGEHCVWNTIGSDIVPEIEKQMVSKGKLKKRCHVVFKAFNHKIDSFGAFPYTKKMGLKRIRGCKKNYCPTGWTGSFALSGKYTRYPNFFTLLGKKWSQRKKSKKLVSIDKILKKEKVNKKKNSIFICGVLGDFCVLDTAKTARKAGYKNVYIVIDQIRSLRLVNKGKVVYPTSPKQFAAEARKHKFRFILSKNLH